MLDDEVPFQESYQAPPFRRGDSVVLRSVRDYGGHVVMTVGFAGAGNVLLDSTGSASDLDTRRTAKGPGQHG